MRSPVRCALLVALALMLSAPARGADKSKRDYAAWYYEAVGLYKAGAYGEALVAYEKAYSLSRVPEPLYGIARCHHQLGEYASAVRRYDEFLELAPEHEGVPKATRYLVDALAGLGAYHLERASWDVALAAFARALKVSGTLPDAGKGIGGTLHAGMGDALDGAGRTALAKAAYERALKETLPDDVSRPGTRTVGEDRGG